MEQRRVVAMGGFPTDPENSLLDRFVLSLARSDTPRVCFVPTASGDAEGQVVRFYRVFTALDCRPTHLQLFDRAVADLESFVLAQDVIYVGGGNTANLLAVWRTHDLDQILRRAWEQGVVLCGVSAGMNCWFEASVTDSFGGGRLAPLRDGLGLLPGSACPHYDGETQRRPTFTSLVARGELPAGWAADDDAALVFAGRELMEVVVSRPGARGYRLQRLPDGEAGEQVLPARFLGAQPTDRE